jgi:molybdenum cofactor biosynthesis enzyme MoaA
MDCRILRHVTLKADGHLGCDDSVGYGIDLGRVSLAARWRLRDVLEGPVYRHVRSSFLAGRVPWPGVCEGCDLLSGGAEPNDTLDRHLELLVEPTLACSLHCACCLRRQIIAGGRSTDALDPALLERLVVSCRDDGIVVDNVHYIGWGEPLMHGDFRRLFEIVKDAAPDADQMVTTAANVDFCSTVGNAALDRLVVSCDGANAAAYARYRRGGDFDTAVRFMRDAKRYGHTGVFIEWKYILFEHNDSDADIRQAQDLAEDIGVDGLVFIVTNSKWHSRRFTVDSTASLQIISPRTTVTPAAAMGAVAASCAPFEGHHGNEHGWGRIDRCEVSVGKFLTVEGWALDLSGSYAEMVELVIDGQTRGSRATDLRRMDVLDVHPEVQGARCGFMFRIPVEGETLPSVVEVRVRGASGGGSIGGVARWNRPAAEVKRRADMPILFFARPVDAKAA